MPLITNMERNGIEKGLQMGLEQRRNIEIARRMLTQGVNLDVIEAATELSRKTLEELMESEIGE
jgi:hypothetical protein